MRILTIIGCVFFLASVIFAHNLGWVRAQEESSNVCVEQREELINRLVRQLKPLGMECWVRYDDPFLQAGGEWICDRVEQ